MSNPLARLCGRFIVLDGPEGCGKSTQVKLLQNRLVGAGGPEVVLVRDPGATRIGELVRSILLNPDHLEMGMRCEMLLYMAARAQMMNEIILPALAAGKFVLSDRFVSSTLAYQLDGEGLTADEITQVANVAIRSRWPDLTILLDMPVERSFTRVRREKDRIELRPPAYHEQVRRNYLAQAEARPDRYCVVNADAAPDDVHERIWRLIEQLG